MDLKFEGWETLLATISEPMQIKLILFVDEEAFFRTM